MVEAARLAEGFGALRPGEHVCWLVGSGEDYASGARTFAVQGRMRGDSVLIVGQRPVDCASWPGGAVAVVDPAAGGGPGAPNGLAPWELVHRRVETLKVRGGALRVLAQMEQLVPAGSRFEDLVALELGWGQWAAGRGASVVCAYRQDAWSETVLRDAACMHSGQVGSRQLAVSFRMTFVEAGCWRVDGVVDFVAAPAFGAAARTALGRGAQLRLRFDGLDMIDAAGMQELAHAVRSVHGGSVRVEGANPTIRRLWRLSGFDTSAAAVEIAS